MSIDTFVCRYTLRGDNSIRWCLLGTNSEVLKILPDPPQGASKYIGCYDDNLIFINLISDQYGPNTFVGSVVSYSLHDDEWTVRVPSLRDLAQPVTGSSGPILFPGETNNVLHSFYLDDDGVAMYSFQQGSMIASLNMKTWSVENVYLNNTGLGYYVTARYLISRNNVRDRENLSDIHGYIYDVVTTDNGTPEIITSNDSINTAILKYGDEGYESKVVILDAAALVETRIPFSGRESLVEYEHYTGLNTNKSIDVFIQKNDIDGVYVKHSVYKADGSLIMDLNSDEWGDHLIHDNGAHVLISDRYGLRIADLNFASIDVIYTYDAEGDTESVFEITPVGIGPKISGPNSFWTAFRHTQETI